MRERIGTVESSLRVFAQNWINRIRPNNSTQNSSPSTPVSTTTNLDTLEVTVHPESDNHPSNESETSNQESLNNTCEF